MPIRELVQQVFELLLQLMLLSLNPAIAIPIIIAVIVRVKREKEYKDSAYYQTTQFSYGDVKHDVGRYGEYLIYKKLKHFEENGARFLFNVYASKRNGETTEIDVVMISSKGICVFESKNFSGWIFGNEDQKYWYQTLPKGRGRSHKERFYNPIKQNRAHIKALKNIIGPSVPMYSVIVFSERCTLKNVQFQSTDVSVINRYDVSNAVYRFFNQSYECLSEADIAKVYDILYPYTQVDAAMKSQHILNIQHSALAPCNAENKRVKTEEEKTPTAMNFPAVVTAEKSDNAVALTLKCPQCNGNLVLRMATRGVNAGNQFYGCSNYPKCRYIKNIVKDSN